MAGSGPVTPAQMRYECQDRRGIDSRSRAPIDLGFPAGFYLAALGWFGLGEPTLLTALGYGLATSILPYFLMFPSMGYGWFGLAGQPRYFLLRQSLVNHFAFSVGLGLASVLL